MENKDKNCEPIELNDEQLENVTGGYSAGDSVRIHSKIIQYCPRCGRLVNNLPATITGTRGTLDGKTVYWVTYNCCGYKASAIETAITQD